MLTVLSLCAQRSDSWAKCQHSRVDRQRERTVKEFESVHRRENKMLFRLKDHNTGGWGCQELNPRGPQEFKVMQVVMLTSTFSWWNLKIANYTNSCQTPTSELNSSCSAVSAPFVHRIRLILFFLASGKQSQQTSLFKCGCCFRIGHPLLREAGAQVALCLQQCGSMKGALTLVFRGIDRHLSGSLRINLIFNPSSNWASKLAYAYSGVFFIFFIHVTTTMTLADVSWVKIKTSPHICLHKGLAAASSEWDAVNSCGTGTVSVTVKQWGVKVSNLIFCFHQTRTIPPSPSKPYRNSSR